MMYIHVYVNIWTYVYTLYTYVQILTYLDVCIYAMHLWLLYVRRMYVYVYDTYVYVYEYVRRMCSVYTYVYAMDLWLLPRSGVVLGGHSCRYVYIMHAVHVCV